jgi:hypothetical protein
MTIVAVGGTLVGVLVGVFFPRPFGMELTVPIAVPLGVPCRLTGAGAGGAAVPPKGKTKAAMRSANEPAKHQRFTMEYLPDTHPPQSIGDAS